MKILVSVIIPAFNRAGVIGRAIESALSQGRDDMEVIVIDDGSDDDTASVARSYGNRVRVISQDNRGPAAARNLGVAHSSGQWIAFLDSDDAWLDDKLNIQLDLLGSSSGSLMAVCSHRTVTPDGRKIDRPQAMPTDSAQLQDQLLNNSAIATDCVIVARELFNEVGGFNESLHTAEDVEFYLKCAARTEVLFDNSILAEVFLSEDGTVSRYGRDSRIISRLKVFKYCKTFLCKRNLKTVRRRAILREYLALAAQQLLNARRLAALASVCASLAWGFNTAQLKCAVEAIIGTRLYDSLGTRLKRRCAT